MKVRMSEKLQGTRNGVRWPDAGGVVELGDQEGADLCAQGVAEPIAAEPKKATAPAAKTADAPKPKAVAKKTSPRKKA
jgi:hypothetical protein